jgi:hypothetical protein
MSEKNPNSERSEAQPAPASATREADAIYQNGRIVGRVLDSQIDAEGREIRFGEIYDSDWLLLPEECDYQQYRIVIQNVRDASKISRDSDRKGRILRYCVAEIVGYLNN